MPDSPRSRLACLAALLCVALGGAADGDALVAPSVDDQGRARPSLTLRASPPFAFAPARISFTGEIRGGPDDEEQLYCPAVVWDWGDDTTSESQADCEPFEKGRSRIRRFYAIEHEFETEGRYLVRLKLLQRNRPVLSASIEIVVN